jgi:seryl-tRNA synthetase
MDSIKSGSQEHLETFANDKLKTFYENLWDQEVTVLIAQDALRKKQDKLHQAQARLNEASEQIYPTPKAGKKAIEAIQEEIKSIENDIKALTNLIIRDTENIADHKTIIGKTQEWVKGNGQTSDNN